MIAFIATEERALPTFPQTNPAWKAGKNGIYTV